MAERKKLTDAYVRSLQTQAKSGLSVADAGGNLIIWVSRTGTKVWRYVYRFNGSDPRRITLGEFPHMDAAEAKKRTAFFEKLRSEGKDPAVHAWNPKSASTVGDVLDFHLTTLSGDTHRHVAGQYRGIRAAYDATLLGDFTPDLARRWLDTNYARRPGSAIVLIKNLTAAFTKAVSPHSGIVIPPGYVNPVAGVKQWLPWLKDYRPTTYATNLDDTEWDKLAEAFAVAYADRKIWDAGIMVLHLGMLTGARPSELAAARWDELSPVTANGEEGFKLTKRVHKTVKKTKADRVIYIFGEAVQVIHRAWFAWNGSNYLFPQRRAQKNAKREWVHQYTNYSEKLSAIAGFTFVPYNLRSAYINRTLDRFGYGVIEEVANNVGNSPEVIIKHYRAYKEAKQAALAQQASTQKAA